MFIKTYTSKYYYLAFNVKVGGKTKRISFGGGTYYNGKQINGSVVVTNKHVAEAIEKTSFFKRGDITCVQSVSEAEPEKRVVEKSVEKKEVEAPKAEAVTYDCKTIQAAARLLNSEYNVPFSQVNSREKVLAKAKELNINFENIK